jgi:hypothetical protein
VLRLYDFIYNNLADVKKNLFQIRTGEDTADIARARVQLLATLTHQLGAAPRKEATNGQDSAPVHITSSVNIGDYNEFMEKFKGRNLDAFTASGIFYNAGTSKVHWKSFLPNL